MSGAAIAVTAAWILAAYLLGATPFGLIMGKLNGIDIREVGSGNIGATNVWRSVGKAWGLAAFFCDFMKGLLPVLLARIVASHWPSLALPAWLPLASGIAAVAGHLFPVWLGFKGGKGIATGFGMLVGLTPILVLTAFGLFVVTVAISRYISLGSLIAAVFLAIAAWPLHFCGMLGFQRDIPLCVFIMVLSLFAIWKHKSNIKRLCEGRENRFF